MSKKYKVFISIFAIVSSMLAGALGAGFVGGSGLSFSWRIVCNFIFMVQSTFTVLCVIGIFSRTKE